MDGTERPVLSIQKVQTFGHNEVSLQLQNAQLQGAFETPNSLGIVIVRS